MKLFFAMKKLYTKTGPWWGTGTNGEGTYTTTKMFSRNCSFFTKIIK